MLHAIILVVELTNKETRSRLRLARYLMLCLQEIQMPAEDAEAALRLRAGRISKLHKVRSPQLRILCPLGALIQERVRAEAQSPPVPP